MRSKIFVSQNIGTFQNYQPMTKMVKTSLYIANIAIYALSNLKINILFFVTKIKMQTKNMCTSKYWYISKRSTKYHSGKDLIVYCDTLSKISQKILLHIKYGITTWNLVFYSTC